MNPIRSLFPAFITADIAEGTFNANHLSIDDYKQYYAELFNVVLDIPTTLNDGDVISRITAMHDVLSQFSLKGLKLIQKSIIALGKAKNTMHLLYDIYYDLNEWLIEIKQRYNIIKDDASDAMITKDVSTPLVKSAGLINKVEDKVLLVFQRIKKIMIRNDNVFHLLQVLDIEDELCAIEYIEPHIMYAISHRAVNCFKKLLRELLTLSNDPSLYTLFTEICIKAYKTNNSRIIKLIRASLPKLARKYREAFRELSLIN